MKAPHIPVLLEGVLRAFEPLTTGWFVDATLGYAGHSEAIIRAHPSLNLIGIDRDEEALAFSRRRLEPWADRITLLRGDFATQVPRITQRPIVGLLADFGVSSLQLDRPDRGFGFQSDVLDMRMDQRAPLSAYDVVNSYSREQLRYLFAEYGEIRPAGRLADAIIAARTRTPIRSARALSELARRTLASRGRIHPATLMFQAIRIEVNNELGQIEQLLDALETLRPPGAIIALITFHSLEDRLVKRRFKAWSASCICDPHALRCTCGNNHSLGTIHPRKPVTASPQELQTNPRSRSAKLRTFVFKEDS
ncbi:MAG: 16S rRNA (cytosine(1402)-N(4))-methyltransferase [Desulfobulbus sp.]|nr:MAG: 16S rRNA (cytosine(1402)-N(4))-methyltransferase [Desulfobulbus sp.]